MWLTPPLPHLQLGERLMGDVEMESKTAVDESTERKKALLVYKSNLQSISDDDDDDVLDNDEDAASIKSDARASPIFARGEDYDMEVSRGSAVDEEDDEEEEEGGVQVERDDDEALNAPSDDDLDSTATPRRSETDEDDDDLLKNSNFTTVFPSSFYTRKTHKTTKRHSETDSASETAVKYAPSPSPSNTSVQNVDDLTPLKLKSGTSNVSAIIATRRRTVARKECEVCHEPRNGRRALLCQQCKCMYHSSCFRQQHPKLVPSTTRQWSCPDCEPVVFATMTDKSSGSTPCKQQRNDSSAKSRSSRNAKSSSTSRGKGDSDERSGSGDVTNAAKEIEVQRLTDLALRGGNKINVTILEQTGEMLHITQTLTKKLISIMGFGNVRISGHDKSDDAKIDINDNAVKYEQQQQQQDTSTPPPPPFLLVPVSSAHVSSVASSQIVATDDGNVATTSAAFDKDNLLYQIHNGLGSLKQLLEQLQVAGIQFEVDLFKEIKAIPNQDRKAASSGSKKQGTGTAGRSASGSKGKSGASRLYSSKQIQKLEEWYQRSSRPESSEIHSMYRIINCPDYADLELQPEGISVKQIRIWFDNRRAKERLDYMRLKMKDISTTDMDADSVKKMKAAYIDEAKEVLEARVSRMRDSGHGSSHVVDEADMALIANIVDHPVHGRGMNLITSEAEKCTTSLNKDEIERPLVSGGSNTQKKRIRIDYVASVRKAVKDARDAGKNEEELKALRTAAIERARERLHVPFKNVRTGPSKPLGKEEVAHIKMKMLKLLEDDAPAEELTDMIELLLTLIIPRDILIESGMQRQLELVLLAHKDNKELVRQTKKLQEEFQSTVEYGDTPSVMIALAEEATTNKNRKEKAQTLLLNVDTESLPGTPGSSPSSGPTPSPESRRPRVKFSLAQLVKLEKYFHKEDTPSKKRLDKIAARLNGIASLDPSSDAAQRSIDYKQIRCWFYKRRSANQPPQALNGADLHIDNAASSSSSSSDTESDNDSKSDKVSKSRAKSKPKALTFISGGTGAKRKQLERDGKCSVKRLKKDSLSTRSANTYPVKAETTCSFSTKSDDDFTGSAQSGRMFNMKQLATIIEEYEKNPRPTESRLAELQKVLNQGDHTDEHSEEGLGVTKHQIKIWFSNRRAKERLDLMNMKINESRAGIQESSGSDVDSDEDEGVVLMPTVAIGHIGRVSTHDRNLAFDRQSKLTHDEAEDIKVE